MNVALKSSLGEKVGGSEFPLRQLYIIMQFLLHRVDKTRERVIQSKDYMKCKNHVPLYLTAKSVHGRKCDYLLYMDSFGTRLYYFGSDLQ